MASQEDASNPNAQVIIIHGSFIVNVLRPPSAKTFSDYAKQVFQPYIESQLQYASRVDIVWDEYKPDSLKDESRRKRRNCVQRRVEPSGLVPRNWQDFLRIDENKLEVFSCLTNCIASIKSDKQVISTHHLVALCNIQKDISRLDPCTHEEADTRIILHLEDAVKEGNTKFSTRRVDTDVVVLALTSVQRLKNAEIWVYFAVGKSLHFLAAHEMARTLGHDRCMALPMFHAFTGCDTVSCFAGRRKRSAWDTRKV